jgi:hypothetical protein
VAQGAGAFGILGFKDRGPRLSAHRFLFRIG